MVDGGVGVEPTAGCHGETYADFSRCFCDSSADLGELLQLEPVDT